MRAKKGFPSSRFARAKAKSSSAFSIHSRVISISTIQDLAFFEDRFQEWVAHFKSLLKFLRPVNEKINGDIAFNEPAQLPNSLCTIVGCPAFYDEEVGIAVR